MTDNRAQPPQLRTGETALDVLRELRDAATAQAARDRAAERWARFYRGGPPRAGELSPVGRFP